MHGNGEFTWEDGKKYIGEYQNDRKHGLGKMIFKNNKKAYGFWKSYLQHGKGILLDTLGNIEKKAEWKDGLKINEFKSDETKGFEVILNLIELDKNKN